MSKMLATITNLQMTIASLQAGDETTNDGNKIPVSDDFFQENDRNLSSEIREFERTQFTVTRFMDANGKEIERISNSHAKSEIESTANFPKFMMDKRPKNSRKHLRQYYTATTAESFTILQMVKFFGNTMGPGAEEWYRKNMPNYGTGTMKESLAAWRALQNAFLKDFSADLTHQEAQTKLETFKRAKNQPIMDYLEALKSIYEEMQDQHTDEQKMWQFYRGLDEVTATDIMALNAKTFNDLHQNRGIIERIAKRADNHWKMANGLARLAAAFKQQCPQFNLEIDWSHEVDTLPEKPVSRQNEPDDESFENYYESDEEAPMEQEEHSFLSSSEEDE